MAETAIKMHNPYKFASDMIKVAIEAGFKHTAGKGFTCKHCKCKDSVRKFLKNKGTVYACHVCGARWGSLVK